MKKHAELILGQCGCVCLCPSCKATLNDQPCKDLGGGLYLYTCRCGIRTTFDFDSYPIPVRH
jgi:hypothetical protein